ncbi:hypothetical protein HAX54_014307, partial [Datura stramonium]|nr:hypothetical protein [Datura stramonium]
LPTGPVTISPLAIANNLTDHDSSIRALALLISRIGPTPRRESSFCGNKNWMSQTESLKRKPRGLGTHGLGIVWIPCKVKSTRLSIIQDRARELPFKPVDNAQTHTRDK